MTSLIRFAPSSDLRRLQREIDDAFEGLFPKRSNGDEQAVWAPRVDVSETEDAYHFHLDVPGVKKENLNINFQDGTLVISGNRVSQKKEDDSERNFVRIERSHGRFYRTFELPPQVQQDKIAASYEDGVLEITVPKAEETKPRRIEVS